MHDPHALDALRLIAPLRPAAHVPESDLSAALKDARRALDAGQSADSIFSALHFGVAVSAAGSAQDPFAGRSPGIAKTGSEPSVGATLSYVRAAPLARLDPLAPSWARSLKPTTTRGPFLNAHGEAFWFDTFLLPRAVTVQAQALWGGPARMLARLPLSTRISPNPRRRLGPGTIWLPAQVLVPLRPASEFVGFQISSGTVGFAGITHSDSGTITLGGAWKVVLRLRLHAPASPVPTPGPGVDASQAVVALPATLTITLDATAPLAISFSDASATAYAADVSVIRAETPPFFDALSNSVVVPGSASPAAFDFTATKSTLFSLTGAASIARNGWALNVVTTPPAALGEANGAGSLWFEFGTPLRAHWTGLARPGLLTRSVLQLAPGLIEWSAQLVSGDVTQTLRLWDEPASDPLRQASAALISIPSSTLGYVSVPGLEGVLLAGKAVAHVDRPLVADGARLAVRMPDATLGVFQDAAGTSVALIGGDASAQNQAHLAIALENALLKVRPPQALLIAGPLTGDQLETGRLRLWLAHRMVLPTLPDPYAANFEFDRQQDFDRGSVIANIDWTSPQAVQLGFSTQGIDSASATQLAPYQPNAVDFGARLAANVLPPHVMLDVSSNADQFGVAIPRESGVARVQGMSLVAEADQVGVITLPPISWEPMLTKAPPPGSADVPLQPPPHDGGIGGLSVETKAVQPIEPIPLLATYEAAIQERHHFSARLPLPFGLTAAVLTRFAEPENPLSSFIASGGSVYFNRPDFAGNLTGGLQLGIRGAPAPNDGILHDPTLPGYVVFTNDNQYAESVLSSDIYTRFGADFGRDGGNGVPLRHYEWSGYGASVVSDWRNTSNPGPSIIETRFDVLVGRTAHEVIQMQSTLYPWFVRVVRTITIDRQPGGWLLREDSGWVATTNGEFEYLPAAAQAFDPTHRHNGAIRGVENVRNIRLDGPIFPASAGPNAVTWQAVRFDADVAFVTAPAARLVVQAGSADRSTPSREISGWIQIGGLPAMSGPGAQPAIAADLSDLLYLTGPAMAPIACALSLGGTDAEPGLAFHTSRVDVSIASDASGLHLVAAVRGSPVLPRDGAWSVARLGASDTAPKALDPAIPIPLVSPNATLAGAGRWHLADPADITRLGDTASPDTRYSLVQSLGAQKVLFDRPRIGNDPAPITLPQPPKLADMGALLHAVSVFPGLANAFDFKSLKALKVTGGALGFQEQFPIGAGELTATLLDLGGSDALKVQIEYHDEGRTPTPTDSGAPRATIATLTVDPTASPRWSIKLERVCFAVLFRGQPLISIFATLSADEQSAPTVADIRVRYEGVLSVLQTIFSSIEQVARFLPGGSAAGLKVGFTQGRLTVRNEFALPSLPLGAGQITDIAVEMGFDVAISPVDLRFVAGLGSEQKPFRWIVSPLAGTGVVRVGVGTGGLDIMVQAGLGVGLAIDLGIASGSASVALAIELITDPDPFELKAILSGRASVDVLQGLASATITLAAGLGIIPPAALFKPPFLPPQLIPPPDQLPPLTVGLVASVSAGIHLSVCWVVDVDWEGYWQFRQDITTPALPLPI